jgi:hypothetical protein
MLDPDHRRFLNAAAWALGTVLTPNQRRRRAEQALVNPVPYHMGSGW